MNDSTDSTKELTDEEIAELINVATRRHVSWGSFVFGMLAVTAILLGLLMAAMAVHHRPTIIETESVTVFVVQQ